MGKPYDNSFDTTNPIDKCVMLGTGAGKSTFFARCLICGGEMNNLRGGTLVLPGASLTDPVAKAYIEWLFKGKDVERDENGKLVSDPERKITKCIFCGACHTPELDDEGNIIGGERYQVVKNGESKLLNIFSAHEFLAAIVDEKRRKWIKEIVIFDEAHFKVPGYYLSLIKLTEKLKNKKLIPAKVVIQMSATFGHIPTSRVLAAPITDYYVVDFTALYNENPQIFGKKLLVFIDKPDNITWEKFLPKLDELQKQTKVIFLGEESKDFATELVQSIEGPAVFITSKIYEAGVSFGDVNVFASGRTVIEILKRKGNSFEVKIEESIISFESWLQQRGRAARNPAYKTAVAMTHVPSGKEENIVMVGKDDAATELEKELSAWIASGRVTKNLQDLTSLIFNHYSKPKPAPPVKEEDGNRFLNLVLVGDLSKKLDPNKIFKILPSERGARNPGEYIFENKYLMKFFKKEQLTDLLIEVTDKKIEPFTLSYPWYQTKETSDDHVYDSEKEAEIVGFYYQAREEVRGYDVEIFSTTIKKKDEEKKIPTKLKLTFKKYKLNKEKVLEKVPA